ncbi:hypothetical protein E4U43_001279 [Claviceps pusilla]|uniref:Uncharacterized protein n=1 Tax=Claviceps pusilla TaxID=123648 RepID=A0A9P7SWZ8_9HYPO|nr:hypothetical protein E4U43_001279 [Claviceps pusilla]
MARARGTRLSGVERLSMAVAAVNVGDDADDAGEAGEAGDVDDVDGVDEVNGRDEQSTWHRRWEPCKLGLVARRHAGRHGKRKEDMDMDGPSLLHGYAVRSRHAQPACGWVNPDERWLVGGWWPASLVGVQASRVPATRPRLPTLRTVEVSEPLSRGPTRPHAPPFWPLGLMQMLVGPLKISQRQQAQRTRLGQLWMFVCLSRDVQTREVLGKKE